MHGPASPTIHGLPLSTTDFGLYSAMLQMPYKTRNKGRLPRLFEPFYPAGKRGNAT